MCLVAVALDRHPRYSLVVAANRDEFHARASDPAHWWREGWLAGRDLTAGGTWFGVRRDGRWALVTNVREPGRHDPNAASRGELCTRALAAPAIEPFLQSIAHDGARYNGYNLVAGDAQRAHWASNRDGPSRAIAPGVVALSNAALGTPWPKVERIAGALASWADRGEDGFDALFQALADRERASDAQLPSTGVPLEWERLLSAPFILGDRYGTRCSTVFAVTRDGGARFVERSFGPEGRPDGVVDERYEIAR